MKNAASDEKDNEIDNGVGGYWSDAIVKFQCVTGGMGYDECATYYMRWWIRYILG